MLYDKITTEIQLEEFVDRLNELSHWERYQLLYYAFEPKLLQLRSQYYKSDGKIFYNLWAIPVGNFGIYATTQMNKQNVVENPGLRTGLYQEIYFHINPEEKGISQHDI